MHYKVFLDTNIYDESAYSLRNGLFTQLREYASSGILELQINSIVEGEVRRHIDKEVGNRVSDLNKAITSRELRLFQTIEEFAPHLVAIEKDNWVKAAQDEFTKLLEECHCERIDLSGSDVEEVFSDYFNKKYPFEEAKKYEFPDAFIIQSILRQIDSLSDSVLYYDAGEIKYVFKGIKTDSGAIEDLRFCIVSKDEGFKQAVKEKTNNRPNDDILLFESLIGFINYLETQNQKAKELQEEIDRGFAKDEIRNAIKEALEDIEYEVVELDGEVEDVNILEQKEIIYKASVISLKENQGKWATVRLFIDSQHEAMLHYMYIDENESLWDDVRKQYFWILRMEKISKFRARAQLTIEIMVEFDEDGNPCDTDFGQFVDRPYEIEVREKDMIEEVYWEKLPGSVKD